MQHGVHDAEVGLGAVQRRAGDRQALERQTQAVDLLEVGSRQARDDRAAVAAQQHQPLLLELQQRFADRAAAHLMAGGDLDLAQPLAGREVALQDGLAQLRADRRRERARPSGAIGRRGPCDGSDEGS